MSPNLRLAAMAFSTSAMTLSNGTLMCTGPFMSFSFPLKIVRCAVTPEVIGHFGEPRPCNPFSVPACLLRCATPGFIHAKILQRYPVWSAFQFRRVSPVCRIDADQFPAVTCAYHHSLKVTGSQAGWLLLSLPPAQSNCLKRTQRQHQGIVTCEGSIFRRQLCPRVHSV